MRQSLDFWQPAGKETLQSRPNRCFDQQVRTEVIGAARDQGCRGPKDFHRAFAQSLPGRGGGTQEGVKCRAVLCLGAQQREAREGRPTGFAALFQRAQGEAFVAFADEAVQERMFGKLGLDQHLTGARLPSGPACDLRDGLRKALGGAKIAGKQPLIGVQDHHQRHVGKVVTLREHLRADQDARLAAVHPVEHGLNGAAGGRAIAVQSGERRVWKETRQGLLDAFRALTHRQQCLPAAAADGGHRGLRAAVMAAKLLRSAMQGHARIAVRTGGDPAAGVAKQTRCIAAPIQEHDDLSAGLEVSIDGVAEPKITGTSALRARMTARSRAEYRKPSCCLYEGSCSSSTTIKLSRGSDVNTAERVPMTIRAAPLCAARHASRRSLSVRPEWTTATPALKRRRKRSTSCGVRAISGTSTSAWPPPAMAAAMTRRYTSVLPLPVTP